MTDREFLRQKFENLAAVTGDWQYATISGETVREVLEVLTDRKPLVTKNAYGKSRMTDAVKREKVIRGLEAHANPRMCETCAGEECPYYDSDDDENDVSCSVFLAADALGLLKEQEPRVLTLEECRERDRIVTIEYRVLRYGPEGETEMETKFEKTARYIGLVGDSPTFACFKAYMDHFSRPKNEYRRTWRCWSADPGNEVRKETKWDD